MGRSRGTTSEFGIFGNYGIFITLDISGKKKTKCGPPKFRTTVLNSREITAQVHKIVFPPQRSGRSTNICVFSAKQKGVEGLEKMDALALAQYVVYTRYISIMCRSRQQWRIRLDLAKYPRKLKITNFWRRFWPECQYDSSKT